MPLLKLRLRPYQWQDPSADLVRLFHRVEFALKAEMVIAEWQHEWGRRIIPESLERSS